MIVLHFKCSCPRSTVICHKSSHRYCRVLEKIICLLKLKPLIKYLGIDFPDTIVAETDINIFKEELTYLTVPVDF